jgi:hypothetical protein
VGGISEWRFADLSTAFSVFACSQNCEANNKVKLSTFEQVPQNFQRPHPIADNLQDG